MITRNALQLLVACQLATFVIAGMVTTIGLIVPAAAEHYGVEVTAMAAQFTWFTGAGLVGQLIAFVVFDYFSVKRVLLTSHLVCAAALTAIHFSMQFELLALWFVLFGLAISTAICGSSTLITQLWDGRARQAAIVAQDAMFNGGGVIFAALTTYFLTRALPFSSTYLVTVAVILFAIALILLSTFERNLAATPGPGGADPLKTEWNPRIILIGISLLVFMTAKITLFIWAPQYITSHFGVSPAVGGTFMSNIFTAALIGSVAGTWLVAHISVRYLVYVFVTLSLASAYLLTRLQNVEHVLLLAFAYGLSVSATFNAYVAFALTQVRAPTHRNIAYMLLMSSLGSSLAPLVSSQIVERSGQIDWALNAAVLMLVAVIVSLAIAEVLARMGARTSMASPPPLEETQ